MARCSHSDCRAWRPDALVRFGSGVLMDGDWFCSPACVAAATRRRLAAARPAQRLVPPVPTLRLGVLLLHAGAVTSADLARALSAQRRSGRRLGAELLALGLAEITTVLRGLSAQAGVSYLAGVDASTVRSGPGGLSRDEVRALGVVPIHVDEPSRLVVVACQAPLPRAALSALRQLTGWAPDPLLVSDADWEALMASYGTEASPARRLEFVKVHNAAAAADHIAASAAMEGTITVTEAKCDTSTWLRVEGPSAISTLLVPYDEDGEWQAATTSH
jgi:hypothetical protein